MNKRSISIKRPWALITLMTAFIFAFLLFASDSFAADETVQKAKDLMIKAPEGAREKYELDLSSAATGGNVKINSDAGQTYADGFKDEGDEIIFTVDIEESFYYDLYLKAEAETDNVLNYVIVDGDKYCQVKTGKETGSTVLHIYLEKGEHKVGISKYQGLIKIYGAELTLRSEAYDLSVKVPGLSVTIMGVCFFALLIILILFYVWIKHAYPEDHKGIWAGFLSYLLICVGVVGMLYRGESALVNQLMSGDMADGQKTALVNVTKTIGLMLECIVVTFCLYLMMARAFFNKHTLKFGNVLMFAYGFALFDAIMWLGQLISKWLIANSINGMGMDYLVKGIDSDKTLDNLMISLEELLKAGPGLYILLLLQKLAFIAFVVAVVTMVYLVVKDVKQKKFLVIVWVAYLMYYIPSLLKNFGLFDSNVLLIFLTIAFIGIDIAVAWKSFSISLPDEWEHYREIQKRGVYTVIFARSTEKKKKPTAGSITKNAKRNLGE